MRAMRESIFCSVLARCADATPASQRTRATGTATRKQLCNRIGIPFHKVEFERPATQMYVPVSDLDTHRWARDKACTHCAGHALMRRRLLEHLGPSAFLILALIVPDTPAAL